MFKLTLPDQSPLAIHCKSWLPRERNAELIRLANLGLTIERLGLGLGNVQVIRNDNEKNVHVSEQQKSTSVEIPKTESDSINASAVNLVDFGEDILSMS